MWLPKYELHLNTLEHKEGGKKIKSTLIQNHPLPKHNCLAEEQGYSLA